MRKSIHLMWVKMSQYEYWPIWMLYLPLAFYWLYLSLRKGDFLFFTKLNKCLPFGGAIGANKMGPLKMLPSEFVPNTFLVEKGQNSSLILRAMQEHHISFPCIVKPNNGERGKGVHRVNSSDHLLQILGGEFAKQELLIQAYASAPFEFGVFFYIDEQKSPQIPSLVLKEFLFVTGDGKKTVGQLVQENNRALMGNKSYLKNAALDLDRVLPRGEKLNLDPIGNHCRGTKFINANHLINDQMVKTFANISAHLVGFEYGRFDLKATDIESLYTGKGIQILEVNGVNAEPAHIYDPAFGLWRAYKDLFKHMRIIYRLSKIQCPNDCPKTTFPEFIENLRQHLKPLA